MYFKALFRHHLLSLECYVLSMCPILFIDWKKTTKWELSYYEPSQNTFQPNSNEKFGIDCKVFLEG